MVCRAELSCDLLYRVVLYCVVVLVCHVCLVLCCIALYRNVSHGILRFVVLYGIALCKSGVWFDVLCCGARCCVVLHCHGLFRIVLYCMVSSWNLLCYVVLCRFLYCYGVLCCVHICCIELDWVGLCCVVLYCIVL